MKNTLLITASIAALVAGIGLASAQGQNERRDAPAAAASEQKAPEGQTGRQKSAKERRPDFERERAEEVEVNAGEVPDVVLGHPRGDRRSPVAALGSVALVSQSRHQLRPGAGDDAGPDMRADLGLVGVDDEVEGLGVDVALLGQDGLERAHPQFGFGQVRMVMIVVVMIVIAHGADDRRNTPPVSRFEAGSKLEMPALDHEPDQDPAPAPENDPGRQPVGYS